MLQYALLISGTFYEAPVLLRTILLPLVRICIGIRTKRLRECGLGGPEHGRDVLERMCYLVQACGKLAFFATIVVAVGTLCLLQDLGFELDVTRTDATSLTDEVPALDWDGFSLSTDSANALVLITLILQDHTVSLTANTKSTFVRRHHQTVTTETEQMARFHSCDLLAGSNAAHIRG